MVEAEIIEEEERSDTSSKMGFDKMVSFHCFYMTLLDLILDTTKDFQRFWVQLLKARPELDEIVNIGYGIAVKCERIEETLESIRSLDTSGFKGFLLYELFQKFIIEDEYEAFETFLKVKREEDIQHLNHNYTLE